MLFRRTLWIVVLIEDANSRGTSAGAIRRGDLLCLMSIRLMLTTGRSLNCRIHRRPLGQLLEMSCLIFCPKKAVKTTALCSSEGVS